MMIFHSYVSLPEGKWRFQICLVIQNFSRKNYGKWLTADFPCLFVCLLEARACNKQHCPANSSILQEYLYIYIHIIYIHYIYICLYTWLPIQWLQHYLEQWPLPGQIARRPGRCRASWCSNTRSSGRLAVFRRSGVAFFWGCASQSLSG